MRYLDRVINWRYSCTEFDMRAWPKGITGRLAGMGPASDGVCGPSPVRLTGGCAPGAHSLTSLTSLQLYCNPV